MMKINFTQEEEAICKLIRDHALSLNPLVTPRLAGGFVRDRIMNIPCHDMDVALDRISGFEFATGLSKKLEGHPSVHKIMANPEKSKHLETAVLTIGCYSIDFVHLRSETYAQTRIPTIRRGTAEEDAFRRDITVNTLFYNLVTEEVEDYTGRGLSDMKSGVIDTPLDPKVTLLDDPLRVLRIFRFRSKLGFEISERIYDALRDPSIATALEAKVSKERNGIEIMKMLGYSNGEDGLIEIVRNRLVVPVFKPKVTDVDFDIGEASEYVRGLRTFLQEFVEKKYVMLRAPDWVVLRLYIVLQYFINMKAGNGKSSEYVNVMIAKSSLSTSKGVFSAVRAIEEGIEEILAAERPDVVEIVLRCKEHWLEVLVILFLKYKEQKYREMISSIFEQNYQNSYLERPLVNGNFLTERGTNVKDFKQILFACHVHQVKNPGVCRDEIYESVLKELGINGTVC